MQLDRAGRFKARPMSHSVKQASKTASIGVNFDFLILAEWDTRADEEGKVVTQWWDVAAELSIYGDLWIIGKEGVILERSKQTLIDVFKWDGNFASLAEGGSFRPVLHECSITVEPEVYNNQTRYKVAWINSVDGVPGGKRLGAVDLAALDAKFNPGAAPVAPPAVDPAEIPF